ncbi:MAG: pantetheine-phosphate adenylyltransferase [Lachnospiraceae bacterium]|nr:pantetheine-phosphate adenylyltransferase [Lachnospiraceae bacterium]
MSVAIYAGTFDPITNGHIDIIKRSAALFDKVIVGVLVNINKKPLFEMDERLVMIDEVLKDLENVEVKTFSGLLVEFAKQEGANVLVRGLRTTTDFEYELQMAQINRKIDDTIDTMFFATDPGLSFISSSAVKELWNYDQDISEYVPEYVIWQMQKKKK